MYLVSDPTFFFFKVLGFHKIIDDFGFLASLDMNSWLFDNMKKPHSFPRNRNLRLTEIGLTTDVHSVCSLRQRTPNPENSGTLGGKYYLSESLIMKSELARTRGRDRTEGMYVD